MDLTLSSWMALGSVPAATGGVYVLELLKDSFGEDFDDRLILMGVGIPGVVIAAFPAAIAVMVVYVLVRGRRAAVPVAGRSG